MFRTTLSLSIATTLLLSGGVLYSPASTAQDADEDFVIEEITVTARKREESLQDIPISVAARTESQIRQNGLRSLEDISQTVASFSVQNLGPGQSVVAIRGTSAGKQDRDLPGIKEQVGVYLDESVISLSLFTPDLDLFDLNRVEVCADHRAPCMVQALYRARCDTSPISPIWKAHTARLNWTSTQFPGAAPVVTARRF